MKKIIKIIKYIIGIFLILLAVILLFATAFVVRDIIKSRPAIKKTSLLPTGQIIYTNVRNFILTIDSMDLASQKIKNLYISDRQNRYFNQLNRFKKMGSVKRLYAAYDFINKNKGARIIYSAYVDKIDANWVLLEIYNLVQHKIYKFNINTGEMVFLRSGATPTYMPAYNKILFFQHKIKDKGVKDDGLYIADMNKINQAKFIIKVPAQSNTILPVSDSEVVFRTNNEYEILLYNLKNNKVEKLPFNNCYYPIAWRDKSKQLVCSGEDDYFLTDLNGKHVEKLNIKFRPQEYIMMYIQEKDLFLILNEETRFYWRNSFGVGFIWDLWVADFTTGRKELLTRNISFYRGIYLPK